IATKSKKQEVMIDESLDSYSDILPTLDNKVTAFVAIMRGCSNFCSYCIVPYVRGPKRSRPHQDILKEIESLIAKGIKEITLLGQSVNEYQDKEINFPNLLRLIDRKDLWLKFTTSQPKNMSNELIDVMSNCQSVCEWLHLPLQSGANKILTLMNRGYTKEQYIDWIYKARNNIPNISITTDIMVGFPGETDADFNETLELVKLIRFDLAYMFKYSERPKTRASFMEPKVAEKEKLDRLTELINMQNKISYEKMCELVGTVQDVLVLGKSKDGNTLRGRTRQNKIVVLDGVASVGEVVKVKIKSLRGWTPYGQVKS
ncbi:MAG: MiaB/RimO family radical SAM methylthiotransferase, partial [Candidatus Stahlbacteria bacterium]|nr:MiaB/RimO family radical SAM methylthiotransferase [Candidatus Stahlbacteria bacterium]